jgi:hypothetical protein
MGEFEGVLKTKTSHCDRDAWVCFSLLDVDEQEVCVFQKRPFCVRCVHSSDGFAHPTSHNITMSLHRCFI